MLHKIFISSERIEFSIKKSTYYRLKNNISDETC